MDGYKPLRTNSIQFETQKPIKIVPRQFHNSSAFRKLAEILDLRRSGPSGRNGLLDNWVLEQSGEFVELGSSTPRLTQQLAVPAITVFASRFLFRETVSIIFTWKNQSYSKTQQTGPRNECVWDIVFQYSNRTTSETIWNKTLSKLWHSWLLHWWNSIL